MLSPCGGRFLQVPDLVRESKAARTHGQRNARIALWIVQALVDVVLPDAKTVLEFNPIPGEHETLRPGLTGEFVLTEAPFPEPIGPAELEPRKLFKTRAAGPVGVGDMHGREAARCPAAYRVADRVPTRHFSLLRLGFRLPFDGARFPGGGPDLALHRTCGFPRFPCLILGEADALTFRFPRVSTWQHPVSDIQNETERD